MIYVTNDDKPGFIGRFASLLGDAGVNIATFALGRDQQGGSAIALVVDRRRGAGKGSGEGRQTQGRTSGDRVALLSGPERISGVALKFDRFANPRRAGENVAMRRGAGAIG